jgi:hypothetical protein
MEREARGWGHILRQPFGKEGINIAGGRQRQEHIFELG